MPRSSGGHAADHGLVIQDDLAALDRVSTPMIVRHLLIPQHDAVRRALSDVGRMAAAMASLDHGRARTGRRADSMVGELSEVLHEHFAYEEREVFPRLVAGQPPLQDLGELHDHHRDVDDRLLRLRGLTAELRSATEVTEDLVTLLQGLTSLGDLAQVHHTIEERLLDRYR